MVVKKHQKIKTHDPIAKLQKAMGFDEQDLKANREGKLSRRQSRRILSYMLLNLVFFFAFSIFSMGTYIFLDSPKYGSGRLHPFLPFISIAFIGFALFSLWKYLPDFFRQQQIRSISGQIRVSTDMAQHRSEFSPPRTHSLYVLFSDPVRETTQSDSFAITSAVYRTLDKSDDDRYTIYYLPHAMLLLTIERNYFDAIDPEIAYSEDH